MSGAKLHKEDVQLCLSNYEGTPRARPGEEHELTNHFHLSTY